MASDVTNRYIDAIRQRGVEVIDVRGQLPINPDPSLRYGLVPRGIGGVSYAIVHWTGDRFTSAFFADLGVPDVGGDGIIDADLAADDEIRLLRWYADYHIGRDEGTWGGLAYGTLALPSGRVYVAWDIGTLTYHAYHANARSYALACPLSRGAAPTAAQLAGLRAALDALVETPEAPVTAGQVLGHQEAWVLDTRNRGTACPGTVLPFVRAYRAGELAAATAPPHRYRWFEETRHGIGAGFLAYWEAEGGLMRHGYPLTEEERETITVDGQTKTVPVQYFQRSVFEYHADNPHPYTVLLRHVGAEALARRGAGSADPGGHRQQPFTT